MQAAENFFETELLDDSSDEESEEQPTRSRSESAAQIAQAVTQMHQTAYEMDKVLESGCVLVVPARLLVVVGRLPKISMTWEHRQWTKSGQHHLGETVNLLLEEGVRAMW